MPAYVNVNSAPETITFQHGFPSMVPSSSTAVTAVWRRLRLLGALGVLTAVCSFCPAHPCYPHAQQPWAMGRPWRSDHPGLTAWRYMGSASQGNSSFALWAMTVPVSLLSASLTGAAEPVGARPPRSLELLHESFWPWTRGKALQVYSRKDLYPLASGATLMSQLLSIWLLEATGWGWYDDSGVKGWGE